MNVRAKWEKLKRSLGISLFLCILFAGTAWSQTSMDELSVDQLYQKAREIAFDEGDYQEARRYAYVALERSPNYHGIRVFVARLYSWEAKYKQAEEELGYVLDENPQNRGALLALTDVYRWSEQSGEALRTVNKGIAYHPDEVEFKEKKAAILYSIQEYEEAENLYDSILAEDAGNQKAREGIKATRLKQKKYRASVSYRYDRFQDIFDPWHFTEIGLSRQTPIGSVIGRVQYARRFGSDGMQFLIDAYPSLAKGLYAYVSGGYSDASIYPSYRFGLSLYKTLPASFEVEAGIRYLDFSTSQTDIYTFALTKYLGSYLFTGRTYLVPSSDGVSRSINVVARRYLGSAEKYISLNGGYGTAPTQIEFSRDIEALDSWSVSLDAQYPLSDTWFLGGNIGYDSSEYPNFVRKRISTKVKVSYQF